MFIQIFTLNNRFDHFEIFIAYVERTIYNKSSPVYIVVIITLIFEHMMYFKLHFIIPIMIMHSSNNTFTLQIQNAALNCISHIMFSTRCIKQKYFEWMLLYKNQRLTC